MESLKSEKGEALGDTLIMMFVILLAAAVLFIFPLMSISNQDDKIAYNKAYTTLVDFTNNAATVRKIDTDNLSSFVEELSATGNVYEVQVEVQRLDQNPSKKVTQVETTKIGENLYYTEYYTFYTNDVPAGTGAGSEPSIYNIKLGSGDIVTVKIKKTNITIFEQWKGFFLQTTGRNQQELSSTSIVK